MKKRIVLAILTSLCIASSSVAFSACGDTTEVKQGGDQITVPQQENKQEPKEEKSGNIDEEQGAVKTDNTDKQDQDKKLEEEEQPQPKQEEKAPTDGLSFELSDDESYYILMGRGKANDKDIVVPSEYNSKPVREIDDGAFYEDETIESLTIPDSVDTIGDGVVYNCANFKEISVSEKNQHYKSIDGSLYSKDSSTLDIYPSGKKDKSFTIPKGVKLIRRSAFAVNSSLENVVFSDEVTKIEAFAFDSCGGLKSVTIPDSVISIGKCAFENCNNLEQVTIGKGVETIGKDAFNGCESLQSFNVSENNATFKTIDCCLCNKAGDKLILHPAGSTMKSFTIPSGISTIGVGAFKGCKYIESVVIPEYVNTIEDDAFRKCDSLKDIQISDGVTFLGKNVFYETAYYRDAANWDNGVLYVGNYLLEMFNYSKTGYTVKDGIIYIAEDAFYAQGLKSIVLPESLKTIGENAFLNMPNFEKVYYKGSKEEWKNVAVAKNNTSLKGTTVYYYSESQPEESGNYWHYNGDNNIECW